MNIKAFAIKHKNINVRNESRSGGVFTALSDRILDLDGSVYGCKLDDHFKAVHEKANNAEERNAFRGSKYVQSDLMNCYVDVKNDLMKNRWAMFSGTSCQVAGLQSFLYKTDISKLICVDIVCYGVPSPLIWKAYLQYVETLHSGKSEYVDFRNKRKYGWTTNITTITINEQEYDTNDYAALFYSNNALRMSCYQCPYKDIIHPSDITIADLWGCEKAVPGFNDNKGVSLVLVNTEKGADLLSAVSDNLEIRECNINDCMQPPLIRPCPVPKGRTVFWEKTHARSMEMIIRHYGANGPKMRIKRLLRKMVPENQIDALKKMIYKIK